MGNEANGSPSGDGKSAEDKGEQKFDLSKVKLDELPDEIKEQVKGFQADYTRKTQALAAEKKDMEQKLKRADEWDNWYERNKDTLQQFNDYAKKVASGENVHRDNRQPDPDNGDDGNDDDDELFGDKKLKKEVAQLKTDLASGRQEIQQTIAGSNQMLIDLMEEIQVGEYPFKINPKKVIEFARAEGVVNVKKAIQGAYKDELIEAEVKSRVEAKLKEEQEKNLKVVNNTMPQGRMVKRVIKRGENGLPLESRRK